MITDSIYPRLKDLYKIRASVTKEPHSGRDKQNHKHRRLLYQTLTDIFALSKLSLHYRLKAGNSGVSSILSDLQKVRQEFS